MRRVVFALILCAVSALTFTTTSSQAGDWGYYDGPRYSRSYDDYYDRPYYRPYRPYRNYSSDCCYSRVSYYRRAYHDRPYYRSYYDRPHYSYYDRPYYRSRYYDDGYYPRRYSYDSGWYYGRPYYTHYSTYRLPSYYRDYYYDGPRYSSYYGGYSDYGYRSYYRPYYSSYDYGYRSSSIFSSSYNPYTRAAWPYDQPRRYYPEGCRQSRIYDDAGGYVNGNGISCGH